MYRSVTRQQASLAARGVLVSEEGKLLLTYLSEFTLDHAKPELITGMQCLLAEIAALTYPDRFTTKKDLKVTA